MMKVKFKKTIRVQCVHWVRMGNSNNVDSRPLNHVFDYRFQILPFFAIDAVHVKKKSSSSSFLTFFDQLKLKSHSFLYFAMNVIGNSLHKQYHINI